LQKTKTKNKNWGGGQGGVKEGSQQSFGEQVHFSSKRKFTLNCFRPKGGNKVGETKRGGPRGS